MPRRSAVLEELTSIRKELAVLRKGQQRILAQENLTLKGERSVARKEGKLEHIEEQRRLKEEELLSEEHHEEEAIAKLEKLEEDIREEVKVHPLAKITYRDFTRAVIGAFFGIVGHFSFFYGMEIAQGSSFTLSRAIMLYVVAFFLAVIFMYFSGFRKVEVHDIKHLMLRVMVIYLTSIAIIIFVLVIFGFITQSTGFENIFKTVSTISILAVLGATTADLIGKE